jgi:Spy/CpxP family protein refolding chaperone
MIRLRTPFLAAALFTGVAAIGLAPALAQTAPAPANSTAAPSEARHHAMERRMPGQFVDGRIAFLKAQLKITPAQEAQVAAGRGGNARER